MNLFRRSWRVQVGELVTGELDVSFKIQRTLAARAGTCELEIHNLTPEHRRHILRAPRRTTYVSVDAGYLEGASRLFTGDLRKAIPVRDGPNWTVKVSAGDGEHAYRTARVSRSFAAGTPLHVAADALADAMGVGVGNAREQLASATLGATGSAFPEGTVLQGQAAAELTRICASAGLQWSIQDGNLQLLPLGGALQRTAIRLAADSGLVEAPEVVNRRTINVKALLQPGLVPGQQVVVDSDVVSGVWRISEAAYAGDTAGQEWTASLTCHRPRPPVLSAGTYTTAVT